MRCYESTRSPYGKWMLLFPRFSAVLGALGGDTHKTPLTTEWIWSGRVTEVIKARWYVSDIFFKNKISNLLHFKSF
jgi:hypothetical protein